MKDSRDSSACQCLSDAQIAQEVNLSATLHVTHITVDVMMDYPKYMARWVSAIRATGKHVWFRGIHPNHWEGNNHAPADMTPSGYLAFERVWILNNPGLFQAGDILDACSEPEQGPYWRRTYGADWDWRPAAPNAGTDAFNKFMVDVTTTADDALYQKGIVGVATGLRSTNEWFATNPALYQSTVQRLGHVTIDSYPDRNTTDPGTAAATWVALLNSVRAYRNMPVMIGEMGYSNSIAVDDHTQERVVGAELQAMGGLGWLEGQNYWVGPGSNHSGGFTHIFAGRRGAYTLRPAAVDLGRYYATRTA